MNMSHKLRALKLLLKIDALLAWIACSQRTPQMTLTILVISLLSRDLNQDTKEDIMMMDLEIDHQLNATMSMSLVVRENIDHREDTMMLAHQEEMTVDQENIMLPEVEEKEVNSKDLEADSKDLEVATKEAIDNLLEDTMTRDLWEDTLEEEAESTVMIVESNVAMMDTDHTCMFYIIIHAVVQLEALLEEAQADQLEEESDSKKAGLKTLTKITKLQAVLEEVEDLTEEKIAAV